MPTPTDSKGCSFQTVSILTDMQYCNQTLPVDLSSKWCMYSLLPKRGEPSFYGQTTHFIFFLRLKYCFLLIVTREMFQRGLNQLSHDIFTFLFYPGYLRSNQAIQLTLTLWEHFAPSGGHIGIFSYFFSNWVHQSLQMGEGFRIFRVTVNVL